MIKIYTVLLIITFQITTLSQFGEWRSLGPQPVNFYGTSSGRVSCVMFDKRDKTGNTIWGGGANGGLWKTTDFGKTWKCMTDKEKNQSSGSIAIDENEDEDHSIIYYGTGEGAWFGGSPYPGLGLLKSIDEGKTWKLITKGLPYITYFHRIVIKPDEPNILFAALQTGVYKSTNYGESWKKILPEDGSDRRCTDVNISPDGKYVYAIGSNEDYFPPYYPGIGYYMSSNGGRSFVKKEFTELNHGRTKIELCAKQPQHVYIMSSIGSPQYLFISTDRGKNFDEGTVVSAAGHNASYNMMIGIKPDDANTIYYGLSCLFRSTDMGKTFCSIGTIGYAGCNEPCQGTSYESNIHPDYHAIDFLEGNPNIIAVGTDGGVYTSTNGGITFDVNTSRELVVTQCYKFSSDPFDPEKITAGAQDLGIIYRHIDKEWNICAGQIGDGANVICSETQPGIMLANKGGSDPGTIYHSEDGGITFRSSTDYPGLYSDDVYTIPMISHPTEPRVFYLLKNQGEGENLTFVNVYKSTDNGKNFNGDNPHSSFPSKLWAQNITLSKSDPGIMYATTGNKMPEWHNPNHIWRYKNGVWEDLFDYHKNMLPDRYFSAIYTDHLNPDIVYVGIGGYKCSHLYKSTDGGKNWSDIGKGLPDTPVQDILIFYSECGKKHIALATNMGAYISSDEGSSWMEFGSGLPKTTITKLFYNRLSGLMRAGTYGRGVWEIDIPGPIYVKDVLVLNTSNVNDDIIICNGGKLLINQSCTIRMKEGKKIVINNGGRIEVRTDENIIFTSQSGMWNGISGANIPLNIIQENVR